MNRKRPEKDKIAPLPRVKAVRAGGKPYTLTVTWADGRRTLIDMTGVVSRSPRFQALSDPKAFAAVRPITHGWGIGWESGPDYAARSLDRLAREQQPMTGKDFAAWQRGLALSNREAADVLGLALGTVKNYRRHKGVLPAVVRIACTALADDRTAFFAHYRPRHAGRPRGAGHARPV